MGSWQERLDRAKREKEERDQQRKATELDRESREISLAREKEQQEILFVEQKRVSLRRDLARFEPNTLLADIKQRVWKKKGVLKQWEYIGPSDARKHWSYKWEPPKDFEYATDSIWYVATGLVYEYTGLHSYQRPRLDGSYSDPSYYRGKSTLALVIGVGIFLPKNERLIFLSHDIPSGLIRSNDAITQVSDPEAPHKLQDLLIKQAIAVTPSDAKGKR